MTGININEYQTKVSEGHANVKKKCKNNYIERNHAMTVHVLFFNVTFNNISVISRRSLSLVEETGVSGENHRGARANRCQI